MTPTVPGPSECSPDRGERGRKSASSTVIGVIGDPTQSNGSGSVFLLRGVCVGSPILIHINRSVSFVKKVHDVPCQRSKQNPQGSCESNSIFLLSALDIGCHRNDTKSFRFTSALSARAESHQEEDQSCQKTAMLLEQEN